MLYKERIQTLVAKLSCGLLEKEEAISLSLLCMIAGKSIFFYGPPGTAKSIVARRIFCAFKSNKFFDYLMNRFSTPEEIFGPLSLSELRRDKLIRKTDGFLPMADFAFLDEIWKSSPAILNALLTIINEKKFRNGDSMENVPLKGLIAASNELPEKGQSLEALYDRFIMRLIVPRLKEKESFRTLLQSQSAQDEIQIDEDLKFSNEELDSIKQRAKEVQIDKNVIDVLENLKNLIEAHNDKILKQQNVEDEIIDVSERRYVNIMEMLRVCALLSDRKSVVLGDLILLKHCLWSVESQRQIIDDMLRQAIESNSAKFICDRKEYEEFINEMHILSQKEERDNIVEINGQKYAEYELEVLVNENKQKVKLLCDLRAGENERRPCAICNNEKLSLLDNIYFEFGSNDCKIYSYSHGYVHGYQHKLLAIEKYPLIIKKDKPKLTYMQKNLYEKTRQELLKIVKNELQNCQKEQENFIENNYNSFITNISEYSILMDSLKETEQEIQQNILELEKLENKIKGL
ncbi:AAA family ATPase [Helicobacter muridarum]|nr:AAA family ATPase [Helicobacter muridarum]STQ85804.1 ATPase [Helicobacter muridarum]